MGKMLNRSIDVPTLWRMKKQLPSNGALVVGSNAALS